MPRKILKNLGLDPNEIRIYLTCLTSTYMSIATIAKKSGIKRTSLYSMVDKLMNKGFITMFEKDGGKVYSAIEPDALHERIKQKAMEITYDARQWEKLIPALTALKGPEIDPVKVEYFNGHEGVFTMLNDTIIKKPKSLKAIVQSSDVDHKVYEYLEKIHKPSRRSHINPNTQIIVIGEEDAKEYANKILREHSGEIKIISPKSVKISVSFQIYDNKIAVFFSGKRKKVGGVFIKNTDLYNSFNSIFDLIWNSI